MANPPPQELPANLGLTPQQTAAINQRIRDIVAYFQNAVQNPATADSDQGNFRVVNLADPKDDLDGVNLRTLRGFVQQAAAGVPTPETTGFASGIVPVLFVPRRDRYGAFTLADVSPAGSVGGTGRVFLVAIDETDVGWRGVGTVDDKTDPVTFTATVTGSSRYGRRIASAKVTAGGGGFTNATLKVIGSGSGAALSAVIADGAIASVTVDDPGEGFQSTPTISVDGDGSGATITAELADYLPGDLIVWNDPANGYEIDEVVSYNPDTKELTLARTPTDGDPSLAQYGSPLKAHTACSFYRARLYQAEVAVDPGKTYVYPVGPLPDVVVVAAGNSATDAQYLGNWDADPTKTPAPPAPGLRTLNGNTMFVGNLADSPLVVGSVADARIAVRNWESIRLVAGTLNTVDNGNLIVAVVFIAADLSAAGLVDTLVIPAGSKVSYTAAPGDRQMPYHRAWPPTSAGQFDWPPTLLPKLESAFDATGKLLPTFRVLRQEVVYAKDGFLDFVVTAAGTAGVGLVVEVQS